MKCHRSISSLLTTYWVLLCAEQRQVKYATAIMMVPVFHDAARLVLTSLFQFLVLYSVSLRESQWFQYQ